MKIIHYKPSHAPLKLQKPQSSLSVEALSEVIFQHTSLEEALEELKREGYISPSGEKILKGIKDLLEKITGQKTINTHHKSRTERLVCQKGTGDSRR